MMLFFFMEKKGGMMKGPFLKVMVSLLLIIGSRGYGKPVQLIANGDFEQELDQGWEKKVSQVHGEYSIDRSTAYQQDSDYEVKVAKDQDNFVSLYQTVDIPETDIDFSIDVKLSLYGGYAPEDVYAVTAVVIEYMSTDSKVLGKTMIYNHNRLNAPYENSPTVHLYHERSTDWFSKSFNIGRELEYLSDIDPEEVAKIKISLLAQGMWKSCG